MNRQGPDKDDVNGGMIEKEKTGSGFKMKIDP
jgi:hypothetical protein